MTHRMLAGALASAAAATVMAVPAPAQAGTYHSNRCYDNGADEYHSRAQILARARAWVGDGVSYSQSRCYTNSYGDYRTDCSGLVSMAWGLGGLGDTWGTVNLDDRSVPIAVADLLPGDGLLRYTGDPATNHAAVFVRWADAQHTQPVVIEQTAGVGHAVERTWSGYAGYQPIRYDLAGTPAPVSLYGALGDGRITYSAIEPGSAARTRTLVSTATLGFVPVAMATLNFNTILVTSPAGVLYRVDVITNNTSLVFNTPIALGGGWTHNLLTYDGNTHLYGTTTAGVLHRYTLTATKPTTANITGHVIIDDGFTLKTLTATGPDWLLATTAAGYLISYHITGPGAWTRADLRTSTWQVFDTITSPGYGLYFAHRSEGSLHAYVDGNGYDGDDSDLRYRKAVDTSGWTQILLSAQPL